MKHRLIMSNMSSGPKRRIKTAENAFEIVDFLHREEHATLGEIANHIELSKSTTHSYLETLIHLDLILKDGNQYELGLKFLAYGGRTRNRHDIYLASKPQLRYLHTETGLTVHLAIKEREELVVLERINPDEELRFGGYAGQRSKFHTPALGKVILAHLSEETVDSIISKQGLPKRTDRSISNREELEEELETVREQGYAINDEEEHRNFKGVARPILVDGNIQGAISIAGPKTEMETNSNDIHQLLQSAADRIKLQLQYDKVHRTNP